MKPKPPKKPITPQTNMALSSELVKFTVALQNNDWDLDKVLAEEAFQRVREDWHELCLYFVALYAILTGQHLAFTVMSSEEYSVGWLYGISFEEGLVGVVDADEFRMDPRRRKEVIREVQELSRDLPKHSWYHAFRELLKSGHHDLSRELFRVLKESAKK